MAIDFENPRIKGKTLEEMIDDLGTQDAGQVGSPVFEMHKAAIQVHIADRLASPRRWAIAASIAAGISAIAAVVSAIAAF